MFHHQCLLCPLFPALPASIEEYAEGRGRAKTDRCKERRSQGSSTTSSTKGHKRPGQLRRMPSSSWEARSFPNRGLRLSTSAKPPSLSSSVSQNKWGCSLIFISEHKHLPGPGNSCRMQCLQQCRSPPPCHVQKWTLDVKVPAYYAHQ